MIFAMSSSGSVESGRRLAPEQAAEGKLPRLWRFMISPDQIAKPGAKRDLYATSLPRRFPRPRESLI
jgi:hypothetical protein